MSYGIAAHYDNPSVPVGNCGGEFGACDETYTSYVTAMVGSMMARQDGEGVVGVANGVAGSDVYVWKVFSSPGNIDLNSEYAGLNQAISLGIKLVVAQFPHTDFQQSEANLYGALWSNGGIAVASVPDLSTHRDAVYPATYQNVVGVSGVKNDGAFAQGPVSGCTYGSGSDYGPMVKLAGPYWAFTTFTDGTGTQWEADSKGDYGVCGNNFAAAHVAGVIALLQAYRPTWSPTQVVNTILATASNSASPNEQIGYGIPNAGAALPPASSLVASISGSTMITRKGTYTWSATLAGGTPEVYQWSIHYDSGLQYGLGSGSSQSVTVYGGDGNFTISVVIWSGGNSATASQYVTNCIGLPSGSCLQ